MAEYRYRAVDKQGRIVKGIQTSESAQMLVHNLQQIGIEVLAIDEHKALFAALGQKKISRRDLINYCFYLQQMLQSGISLVEALDDLQDSLPPGQLKDVVAAQASSLKEGRAFSESMQVFPKVFDEFFISLIKAGERSGELVAVLQDLNDTLVWQDEMIAQTKKALMLPAFIGVVVFAVVFFLMTYLVPQLVGFITAMGETLPLHTRVLISVSGFFVTYWWVILSAPLLLWGGVSLMLKHSPSFRLRFDALKLKIWILGPLQEKVILARFVNYLALLYNAGIPLLEGLKITETIVVNKALQQGLIRVRQLIGEGADVAVAFELSGRFPRLVLSMLRVGEKTGDLGAALKNVGYFYKRDVDETIANVQQMIEPVMTVIMGVIIGWVMISVLGPVYDMIANIKM